MPTSGRWRRGHWARSRTPRPCAILTPLLADPDPEVRTVAAWALGQIESASALPALEKAKDDSSPSVRRAVQWAIRQIDDDRR